MSDGNTAVQVSPTEANMIADMFHKAANAIVAASNYPAQVESLSKQVADLQDQLNRSQLHASELDTTLHEVRAQRDQAQSDIRDMQRTIDGDGQTICDLETSNANLATALESAQTQRDDARRERDDYGLQVMQLQDELASARAALSDIQDKVAAFFPAKPEPEAPAAMPDEAGPIDPAVSATAPEPETRDDWAPGYLWDYTARCYRKIKEDPKPSDDEIPF